MPWHHQTPLLPNDSKVRGRFRHFNGLQLISISEVAAKDDFASIKNAGCDDILAAHRVPPQQLLGMIPTNTSGFDDVGKARDVFKENEIEPLIARMIGLNDVLGARVFSFRSA